MMGSPEFFALLFSHDVRNHAHRPSCSQKNKNFKMASVPPLQILANAATKNHTLHPNTTSLNSLVNATSSSSATSSTSLSNTVPQTSESSIATSSANATNYVRMDIIMLILLSFIYYSHSFAELPSTEKKVQLHASRKDLFEGLTLLSLA